MKSSRQRKSDYLWHRPNTDAIWFSRAVPKRLWASEGKRVIQKSLGTTDRREAQALARRLASELDQRWGLLPGTGTQLAQARAPLDHELDEAAVVLGYELPLTDADAGRRTLAGKGRHMYQAHVNYVRSDLEEQIRATATGDDALVRDLAAEAMAAFGVELDRTSDSYRELVDRLNGARLANLKAQHARNMGELDVVVASPVVERVRQRERDKAKPGETLLELFDKYADHRLAEDGKRSDTLAQDRKIIEQFAGFVGPDRSIQSIKPEHVREYRDVLRQLPPKWSERTDMRELSMREAAAKARAHDLPCLALTTINKHLSTISPLFAWLIEERWDVANPCTGLHFKRVKGKNPRPPFGTARLNAVLASPLFTGFQADGKEHRPGNMRANDWRYWIPMLCLFTGMRVGEAAQLRTEDVTQHDSGVWVIDIHHKPEKGQTTKAGQSRATVAHSKLVELGFVEFVEGRRSAGGDSRLFPELVANERDQIGAKPSEFWRDYLTRIKIKAGRDGLGAHSFRHELADRLRDEVGLVDDQVAVALGHDQKSTTAGYGTVRQGTVKFLAPAMEQVRFDGVDFSHLTA
ncbi:tyrosine-type recombinase/integrase [Novosphingobium sp. M1R2S20]|uniref:Tyrosine-type recombinase/integrase n=1 Tax=Novosphingobium rhizovicinum TaxID=3228928 RepID=A0ABV3R7N0_9SPHN